MKAHPGIAGMSVFHCVFFFSFCVTNIVCNCRLEEKLKKGKLGPQRIPPERHMKVSSEDELQFQAKRPLKNMLMPYEMLISDVLTPVRW